MNAFLPGQTPTINRIIPEAVQKPKKAHCYKCEAYLGVGIPSDPQPHRRHLPTHALHSCESKPVDFETSALCRHDIISLIPQARIYRALLPHLLNHLMNMTHTHTSRKRGHWPNATETSLISFHEGCFSCQVYSDRIRSTQKVR